MPSKEPSKMPSREPAFTIAVQKFVKDAFTVAVQDAFKNTLKMPSSAFQSADQDAIADRAQDALQ